MSAASRRELVFGFVVPLGVERERVTDALRKALDEAKYHLEVIEVSKIIQEFDFIDAERLRNPEFLERKELLMDAGDRMRSAWEQGDTVALASMLALRQRRKEINERRSVPTQEGRGPEAIPADSVAFLVDSIKHPHELERLRTVYGPAFVSVGVYAPPAMRRAYLQRKSLKSDAQARLEKLLDRDTRDSTDDMGQNVLGVFDRADFIVNAASEGMAIESAMRRLVELLFGNVHLTPSRDELGMYMARATQVRSGSLARQVGATILRDDGSLVAVGTNEVAKPLVGGLLWNDDDDVYPEGRDRGYGVDASDRLRKDTLRSILDCLASANVLDPKYCGDFLTSEERFHKLYFEEAKDLQRSKLQENIDHVRAVHAEVAALLDCARHGISVHRAQMFATTFPCHECARHIVAAGIKRVIYLEPYPKSATRELYSYAIEIDPVSPEVVKPAKVVFETFVGVAPPRYMEFFALGGRSRKRKEDGAPTLFSLDEKIGPWLPYYTPSPDAIVLREVEDLKEFQEFAKPHLRSASQARSSYLGE